MPSNAIADPLRLLASLLAALLLAACAASPEPPPTNRRETLHVVPADGQLQRFNAGRPQQPLSTGSTRSTPPAPG